MKSFAIYMSLLVFDTLTILGFLVFMYALVE
jgi:hypothetical protein